MSDLPLLSVDWRPALAAGVDEATWRDALDAARAAATRFHGERAEGAHAFADLAGASDTRTALQTWCDGAPPHDIVLVAGMGGSALSARVFDGLRDDATNPRLVVLDSVDPVHVARALRQDPARVLLVAVSKSGVTLETLSVFLVLEAWLRAALGDEAPARIAVVCGEEDNSLRGHASTQGYAVFSIPTAVGGRFSGFTPAGLMPAELGGVSLDGLVAGAEQALALIQHEDPDRNPALALAALHLAAVRSGRMTAVLMPYGVRLAALAPWWAQLVGESLGKSGQGIEPVAARGPADQHSLLQLWLEGPDTRLVWTVSAAASRDDTLRVPSHEDPALLGQGHALADILRIECEATREALAQCQRPAGHITLRADDEASVGAFLMSYQVAVVWIAHALGISPYGQPAVQLGKDAAKARLRGV